jgi:hypothetical protein
MTKDEFLAGAKPFITAGTNGNAFYSRSIYSTVAILTLRLAQSFMSRLGLWLSALPALLRLLLGQIFS